MDIAPDPKKDVLIFMNEDEDVVPKEQATKVRILTQDSQGNRVEIWGNIGPEKILREK